MGNAKPVLGLADIIDRLDGEARWSAGPLTVGIDCAGAFGDTATEDAAMAATLRAISLWDDLIAIDLVIGPDAQIGIDFSTATTFGGTYTTSSYSGMADGHWLYDRADIAINTSWTSQDDAEDFGLGARGAMTLLHEIGHALGLDHPGAYNGSAGYDADAEYRQDTEQYTVMSYFRAGSDGSGASHVTADGFRYAATPLLHDIAAIQTIFGADMATRTGNTVYGFGSNAGNEVFDFAANPDPVIAIWDAGGIDTLNASGFRSDQTINLRAGCYSSIGDLQKNVAIAYGATIERAIGGRGDDKIIGNNADNRLWGGQGDDRLYGSSGTDRLYGNSGADYLNGGSGNDRLCGGGGNDRLFGGDGNDRLIGNSGKDWISGGAGNDRLIGGGGNDTFLEGDGRDVILGQAGYDTVRYAGSADDYHVKVRGNTAFVTELSSGDTDKLVGIEKLIFKGDVFDI
ncbi:MAG: M10 family metallopeptidase C-terminal domain-containing protein [Hyphomicrobiaceae bacterium]